CIFRGAKGDKGLLGRRILLRKLDVYVERDKFLVEKTSIAKFGTAVICKDNVSREIFDGVFHCAENCANIDHRWAIRSYNPASKKCKKKKEKPLAIFMQDKFSDFETKDRTISQNDLQIWYETTLCSVQKYSQHFTVVLVFFTVRTITKLNMKDMPQLILIDEECMSTYLSPTFARRGILEPLDLDVSYGPMDTSD
ncbi:hypothetical protein BGZ46_005530, partial [Entomortierella lignicola]